MAEHLTIPGALEWDAVERHSIATLRYAGGKEHDVKYVSEVAYDALAAELESYRKGYVTRFAYEALRRELQDLSVPVLPPRKPQRISDDYARGWND